MERNLGIPLFFRVFKKNRNLREKIASGGTSRAEIFYVCLMRNEIFTRNISDKHPIRIGNETIERVPILNRVRHIFICNASDRLVDFFNAKSDGTNGISLFLRQRKMRDFFLFCDIKRLRRLFRFW